MRIELLMGKEACLQKQGINDADDDDRKDKIIARLMVTIDNIGKMWKCAAPDAQ